MSHVALLLKRGPWSRLRRSPVEYVPRRLRAGMIEYILVAVVIIGTVAVGMTTFGDAVKGGFESVATWVTSSISTATGGGGGGNTPAPTATPTGGN